MVYLEELSHRNKKEVNSLAWQRERRVKTFSPEKKKKMIQFYREKSGILIRKLLV